MKKIITLLLILFISFACLVSSLKTFEIDETEKLSLGLEAKDPDADKLIYTFTGPLDENGEWQTAYGDSGEYTATITVSDGVNEVSEEILIIVNRKEAEPVIDNFMPKEDFIVIEEGDSIKFEAYASDLNDDELTYKWLMDDKVVSDGNQILFETDYEDAGKYVISFVVSDNIFDVSKEWSVNVNNVDIKAIMGQIEDVTILETETASLELPDFEKYGLSYEISEPLGNENKWKTGYDDGGEYLVTITAEGKDFKGEENVKITVKNKDRAPKFVGLNNVKAKEGQEVKIELEVVDPDNDDINFSAKDIPQDARLRGNIFTWTPGFDFVQRDDTFDYVLDKFNLLSKSINVVFTAKGNELDDKKNVKITVRDTNRPFVLGLIEDIEVNEGEIIEIDPGYSDPDNDRVSFSYSGFMNGPKKDTGFEDAGEYIVKIVATDGYHTETKFVNIRVNDVNRKPVFDKIGNLEVFEGNEISFVLSASDPDNDAVSFSAEELPKGAELKDNLFVWKPGFEVVNGTEKEFSVDFVAFDGIDTDTQTIKITVLNVNKAPEIVDTSDNLIALKSEPILFEVNAIDIDGDELTYKWKFGFFDEYEDSNQHKRIFTITGTKKVEVIVSDGIETVSKVWNVEVI